MNPVAFTHVLAALIMIGVSLPLVKRKIKRNRWYGIRIQEAFKSEERWLAINQYGGRLILRMGIVVAAMAGVGLALQKKYWLGYAFASAFVILIGLFVIAGRVSRYAAKTNHS